MGIFAPRNVLGPEQGEGGGVCLLRTTKPSQLGPTFPGPHLWPQAECLLNICYLFWCLGCGLIGLSHENIFSPWLECTGMCFPLTFQWRHTSKPARGHTVFRMGICSISPPPSLQRPSLTFQTGHTALGKSCRGDSVHCAASGLWPLLGISPRAFPNKKQSE